MGRTKGAKNKTAVKTKKAVKKVKKQAKIVENTTGGEVSNS